jgi:hypothetical protein
MHTMNAYGGMVDIAEVILKLGPKWRGMLSFTPPPLYPGIRAPDTYRIGDRTDRQPFGIFIEKTTLESNRITFPSSFSLIMILTNLF